MFAGLVETANGRWNLSEEMPRERHRRNGDRDNLLRRALKPERQPGIGVLRVAEPEVQYDLYNPTWAKHYFFYSVI